MGRMTLYHTGFEEIRRPDIYYGRKNADFGQGFYTSDDRAFSERWAKERTGSITYFNVYELETDGLSIKRFERGEEWFDYIYNNRSRREDYLREYDVIIGPIANDTIYNVMGITTSGFLAREDAAKLLMIGPCYQQIVIKSERAVSQLFWQSSEPVSSERIAGYQETVRQEETAYQELFAEAMQKLLGDE